MEIAVENALPFLPSAGWSPGLSDKVELFDFNLPKGTPMTDDRLPLAELAAKSGDSDFLRAIAESVLQLIMEADVDGLIGAGRYVRGDSRQTWRNGYCDRTLDTRLNGSFNAMRQTTVHAKAIAAPFKNTAAGVPSLSRMMTPPAVPLGM